MNNRMITSGLFELQDEGYRVFQAKLMPNISCDRIIGVRTPDLRSYAKKIFQMPEARYRDFFGRVGAFFALCR